MIFFPTLLCLLKYFPQHVSTTLSLVLALCSLLLLLCPKSTVIYKTLLLSSIYGKHYFFYLHIIFREFEHLCFDIVYD